MDTREKILPLATASDLLTTEVWTVVTGLFDPLTLAQAQRLAAAAVNGRKLLAIVMHTDNELLPATARAALVAGLRVVDAVTVADLEQVIQLRSPINKDLCLERERSAEFVEFVVARQKSVAGSNGSQK